MLVGLMNEEVERAAETAAPVEPVVTAPPAPPADVIDAAHLDSVAELSDGPDIDAIIRRVHGGELVATDLPIELRQQCVAHLSMQGFTTNDIAAAMHMNERTVRRDRAAIRSSESIMPDMHLGDELLGEYQRYLHAGMQRLTRRANDKSEPAYVRLWAEEAITRMYQKFIDTVHKLNYLNEGHARIRHQLDTDPNEQKRHLESYEARIKLHDATDPVAKMFRQTEILKTLQAIGAPVGEKPSAPQKSNTSKT